MKKLWIILALVMGFSISMAAVTFAADLDDPQKPVSGNTTTIVR